MRVIVCVFSLILTSSIFAQTGSGPRSVVPTDPTRLPLGEAISTRQLLIPPKAVKELQLAQAASLSGDVHSSARHLEKALQIYPNCLEAHNNLGSRYFELTEYEKAVAEFRKAIELDSQLVQPVSNLSVALFLLRRYPEAEAAARQALDLDPRNPTARYMLGATLATEKRNPAEAIQLLHQTTSEYPDSRLLLAMVLVRLGSVEEAKAELQEYLKAPEPGKKQNVERWLEKLARTSSAAR
jgi:Flp pilus assembly protein TadD